VFESVSREARLKWTKRSMVLLFMVIGIEIETGLPVVWTDLIMPRQYSAAVLFLIRDSGVAFMSSSTGISNAFVPSISIIIHVETSIL